MEGSPAVGVFEHKLRLTGRCLCTAKTWLSFFSLFQFLIAKTVGYKWRSIIFSTQLPLFPAETVIYSATWLFKHSPEFLRRWQKIIAKRQKRVSGNIKG